MEIVIKVLVCLIAGAAAGIGTGFAGMSAASIIGPMLTVFLGIPAYQAVGVGLASDVLASAISAWTYKKNKNLDIKNSLPLIVTVLIMTVVGSYVGSLLPDRAMSSTTQFGLIMVGLKFLLKPVNNTREKQSDMSDRERITKAIAGGVIVGSICGFMGAGGGMMLLFVLTTFLGYELHMAVGTSVFIMTFTAFTGGVSHFYVAGIPDPASLLMCIVFTFVFARIAAVIANKASSKTLSRVAGSIMIGISVVILFVDYVL